MPNNYTAEQINEMCKSTMIDRLGMKFVEVSDGRITATMPVDERTVQPARRLHGGASAAFAETIGSVGSFIIVDHTQYQVLGVEVSASHVSSTTENEVFGIGTLVHRGKTSHVWEIRIEDKNGKIISIARLTNRIIPIKKM